MAVFNPYPYQTYAINRVLQDNATGLFLEPGLGKSVITLTAIKELKYNYLRIVKTLIIAPKTVAQSVWPNEIKKWNHLSCLRYSLVIGTKIQRIKALATPADIYITTRDLIHDIVDYYKHNWPFDLVVIDESSSFKNHRSRRFKSLRLIRNRISRIVALTGTPASNSLMDLWSQIYLLDGGQRLFPTIGQYREKFFVPDKRNQFQVFSYEPKPDAVSAIQHSISDICISMKAEDYLDLPERIYNEIPVNLDAAATKAYTELEKELLLQLDEGIITADTAGVLTGKLLQLCNGAVYDADRRIHNIHNCKIEAFLDTLESLNGQPVLVFYNFQHDLERLLSALTPLGLRVRVYKNPTDEQDWNAGNIDILLAHPARCAYGLNLQAGGHHAVWFGLTWSLEQYEQANKRLHRQGQQHPVVIHTLVTQGGMDEDVIAALQRKENTQNALMEALKARIQKAKGAVAA